MPFHTTAIAGVLAFEPRVFPDPRGYFYESYNRGVFVEGGISDVFVQDNQSRSVRGVLRGLHYQNPPMAQSKLLRVLEGEVLDVAVDLRRSSPTFGQNVAVVLSAENKRQLYIPRGFAHGFVVLSETAEIFYKCDNYYSPGHEAGIIWNDPTLAVDWKIDPHEVLLSEKDAVLPRLEEATCLF